MKKKTINVKSCRVIFTKSPNFIIVIFAATILMDNIEIIWYPRIGDRSLIFVLYIFKKLLHPVILIKLEQNRIFGTK